jgi:asparagine synthase (glutamine-hydrolysing)
LFEATRGFLPTALIGVSKHKRPAPWLDPDFVKRNRSALQGYKTRLKLFGPAPSFQENVSTLQALQRQLACEVLSADQPREKRYPYLDRGLLEFMYSVPREQLVRPGQRRSLVRRALVGIVPDELLNRKRKAFVARSPIMSVGSQWTDLLELTQHMLASELGIVDAARFATALRKVRERQEVGMVTLLRTLLVECWLRNLQACSLLPYTKSGVPLTMRLLAET